MTSLLDSRSCPNFQLVDYLEENLLVEPGSAGNLLRDGMKQMAAGKEMRVGQYHGILCFCFGYLLFHCA
ncbi:hypothetical protein K402DRAFT_398681 [Aulographum hederae CBS 113979]|uniref:Uncharacterized protein n=1 Tax=Aulographum hederae CBS 113979 TaxID=1176131 RepID=A0A6G1GKN2_9PEZI|nr:hypothetical protein K402DRAFT_398681 [Aulographum hederae CBS 113979]